MANVPSATRGVPVTLQDDATTGNGKVIAIPSSFRDHLILIRGSAGIGAGKVKVEIADSFDYAGTWALQGSEQTLVASTELAVAITGIIRFLRARISTNVTGGTVTVTYVGN